LAWRGFNLFIIAPLYARLEGDVKIEGNKCEFKVAFRKYFDKNLEVVAIGRENKQRRKYTEVPLTVSVPESTEIDEDLREWTREIRVPELTERDSLQISLLSKSPRLLIQSFKRDFVARWGIEPAWNPLLSALSRFYLGKKEIEIKDYLASEEGNQPQDKFEQKVVKLLNLCGFSVVRIGNIKRLEILKDAEGVHDRGKADILAYSERLSCLLLAECTTEIQRLMTSLNL
jgi:hypothetical protein